MFPSSYWHRLVLNAVKPNIIRSHALGFGFGTNLQNRYAASGGKLDPKRLTQITH